MADEGGVYLRVGGTRNMVLLGRDSWNKIKLCLVSLC